MHPYRDSPVDHEGASKTGSEELVLYALLFVIGAVPTIVAIVQGTSFGIDGTLGALMMAAGLFGAIGHLRRTRRA